MGRYLFFYQNYTGEPFHWSFDHVWSLCVEEHFYIMLPILFLIIRMFKSKRKLLIISLIFVIILGFGFKYYMLNYTNSQDTYSATHNRIDALAWGVLLNVLINQFSNFLQKNKYLFYFFIIGLIGLSLSIWLNYHLESIFYSKVVYHSVLPLFFTMMILGTYYYDFSKLKIIRILGYYSYNWYLWHPVIVILVSQSLGTGWMALIIYLVLSFIIGVLFTVGIEEPFLRLRKKVM